MRVYYMTSDNGDGSSSVLFIRSKELAERLCDPEYDPEAYGGNEGSPGHFDIPDGENTIEFSDEWLEHEE